MEVMGRQLEMAAEAAADLTRQLMAALAAMELSLEEEEEAAAAEQQVIRVQVVMAVVVMFVFGLGNFG
jgi:hypothetical protein